jgi:inorganic pyrophosphatase
MKLSELPLGDPASKYEYQPEWDVFFLDRVLPGPLRFPAAYGFIPQTVGPDGDEVDVLIIQEEPVSLGVVVKVRPIAMFSMSW